MDNSTGLGFMAAFAVSGSVVLIASQFHKRLLSNFMKKIEFELSGTKRSYPHTKKRVRFAEDVMEPSSNNKEYRKRGGSMKIMGTNSDEKGMKMAEDAVNNQQQGGCAKLLENMPLNRQILYKGIIEYKLLKGYNTFSNCF